ncbi:class I SAM-dependent methyltransferase [uncultured Phascolarctobacterium sp.]|uniref:class I SAM-dependent methyltransferase n=1 Tax=uncultured Phascolarctobacterium sp. TaxID=512296 RepID=UPI0025F6B4A9|nr:class I SAM-dependent methyltransferase [uncultured Phascolarctobacterium sp.]
MGNNKDYWDERARKNGHTGWNDLVIYYYDQKIRLNTIEYILKNTMSNIGGLSLDYGCGSGDFSKVCSKYFSEVIATDISEIVLSSAKKIIKNSNIIFVSLNDKIFDNDYEVILSITVLQHILDDKALEELLRKFAKSLKVKNGKVILLESVAIDEKKIMENNYLKIRSFKRLLEIINNSGLIIESSYEFYNPLSENSSKFQKLNNNIFIRILKKLAMFDLYFAKKILKMVVDKYVGQDIGIINGESTTKIMILKNF